MSGSDNTTPQQAACEGHSHCRVGGWPAISLRVHITLNNVSHKNVDSNDHQAQEVAGAVDDDQDEEAESKVSLAIEVLKCAKDERKMVFLLIKFIFSRLQKKEN